MDPTARARWLPLLAAMMAVAAFVSVVIHNRIIRRNRTGSIEVPVSSVQAEDIASVDATTWEPIPSTPSPTPLFLRKVPTDNPSKGGDPVKPANPATFPVTRPASTLPLFQQTYFPGDLTVIENGLLLSTGLRSRQLAHAGEPVIFKNGTESSRKFHIRPDGAATFEGPGEGQWVYVSNAESTDYGGVGAITFDADGGMVKYEMILEGTHRNCQGGKTPWNSWVSCEENEEDGQCWETDPFGNRAAQVTLLGGEGGNYEAVACDNRDPANPRFFVTDDNSDGEIRRFTPDPGVVENSLQPDGDPWDILSNPGTMEYLVLHPFDDPIDGASGNFSWTSDLKTGMRAAKENFRSCEGMDIMGGTLYFVSSSFRELFTLDLDAGTYRRSSTFSDDFNGKPDAIALIDGMVYFAEEPKDNKKAGVFGRDLAGNFYTILESDDLRGDATGIAFSPSKKHLYVAFQKDGQLFEITRTDGGKFGDVNTLGVTYHDKSGGYDSKE